MGKKINFGILVGLLVIIGVLSVNITGFSIEEQGVIEIGSVLPLTGGMASYGQDVKSGIDLAVKEHNLVSEYEVRVVYEDSGGDGNSAVNAVKKFIEIDDVNILFGPMTSWGVLAAAPLTEEKKVILFNSVATAKAITEAGDYVFRNRETSVPHGEKMAEFLVGRGVDKVAVFSAQASNSLTYADSFVVRFRELGGEVVSYSKYAPEATDFRTEILKIKDDEVDGFYIAGRKTKDAGLLVKQIRESGFDGLITGNAFFEGDEFLAITGDFSEGVVYTSSKFNLEDPNNQNYRNAYKSLYGEESNYFAANAYDGANIVFDAIDYCEGDDTDCIRDYLYGIKDYHGITGLTSFDLNGDVDKEVVVKVIRNGIPMRVD